MRKPYLPHFCIFILLACCGCFQQPEKEYHFGGKVKTVYSYNSRGQLHGIIRHYDEFTKLWKEETWVGGKKQGPTITYGDRGQRISEVNFTDNEEHGRYKAYFDNGTLRTEYYYDHGIVNGLFKKYYEDGTLAQEVLYINGSKHGPEIINYPGGSLQQIAYYIAGNLDCAVIRFFENGAVQMVENYRNNRLDGVAKEYYESGKLKLEMLFNNDRNIITIEYSEAGEVLSTTENKRDFNFLKRMKRQMPAFHWD